MPRYNEHLRAQLGKLNCDDVNKAIKRYLRVNRLVIAAVAKNGEELKRQLASEDPSPMTYNSPKPEAVQQEDKIVEKFPLHLRAEDIEVKPVSEIFK